VKYFLHHVSISHPLRTSIGNASNCQTKRTKIKYEEKKVAMPAVLAELTGGGVGVGANSKDRNRHGFLEVSVAPLGVADSLKKLKCFEEKIHKK
jgi:hypothetical protein